MMVVSVMDRAIAWLHRFPRESEQKGDTFTCKEARVHLVASEKCDESRINKTRPRI